MSVCELVEEIKELANFVEFERTLENKNKAEDFVVELIKEGVIPVEFKIIKNVREAINRERVHRDYKELVGNITIEHLRIIKQYLLEKLQQ